jgi:hypothetical protein
MNKLTLLAAAAVIALGATPVAAANNGSSEMTTHKVVSAIPAKHHARTMRHAMTGSARLSPSVANARAEAPSNTPIEKSLSTSYAKVFAANGSTGGGPVCTPGDTIFMLDGQPHICQ